MLNIVILLLISSHIETVGAESIIGRLEMISQKMDQKQMIRYLNDLKNSETSVESYQLLSGIWFGKAINKNNILIFLL